MRPFHRILTQFFAYTCFIGVSLLSLISSEEFTKLTFNASDKLKHFIAYFVMGFLFNIAYPKHTRLTVGIMLAYSILIEFIQQHLAREKDIFDIFANFLGLIIAWIFWYFFVKKHQKI